METYTLSSKMVTTWRLFQCLPCNTSNRKQCAVRGIHENTMFWFVGEKQNIFHYFTSLFLSPFSMLSLKGTTKWLETKPWEAWAVWPSTVCCKARPKHDVPMWAGYRQRHHEKTCALWVCEKKKGKLQHKPLSKTKANSAHTTHKNAKQKRGTKKAWTHNTARRGNIAVRHVKTDKQKMPRVHYY